MTAEPEILDVLSRIGIAAVLGLLVGLQREKSQTEIAGFRTFPLISVLGTLLGRLDSGGGPILAGVGLLCMAGLLFIGNASRKSESGGITTEVAVLLMYSVGVFLAKGPPVIAVIVGGSVAIILQIKPQLHRIAHTLDQKDIRAIMRFVLIAAVILPLLPDKVIGPFEALNPHNIWKMVVLIVAINLTGYLIYRFVGSDAGTVLSGVLGGIISSTATTVAESKRAKGSGELAQNAAIVILIASSVTFFRVLIEVGVIAPGFLEEIALPLGVTGGVSIATSLVMWFFFRQKESKSSEPGSPEGFKAALIFGFLYAVIGVAIGLANKYLGKGSLLWIAGLSGLTDVDAITLSASGMVKSQEIDSVLGWKMILLATLSNTLFKLGLSGFIGGFALFRKVALCFLPTLVVGAIILFL